jgi:putative nucleotidyltransferase with HDIG domain
MISRDILVNWFIKNYPDEYKTMLGTNHYVDPLEPNPFHIEGSVWTHTLMVMTWIEAKFGEVQNVMSVLLTAGLLHDLGKPIAKEYKEATDTKGARHSFGGHEGISTLKAIGILKNLQKDFPEVYTLNVVEDIIKVISLHGCHIDSGEERLDELLTYFREADKRGAVRNVDENIFSQYKPRHFARTYTETITDKELVMMVGYPCSGKSHYVATHFPNHVVVSRDNFMQEYTNQYKAGLTYNEAYIFVHEDKDFLQQFNNEFNNHVNNMSKENKVVVDMSMSSLSSRRKMINRFSNHKLKCVVMLTDETTIKHRNKNRNGKFIKESVFSTMGKSFVMPVLKEGFVEIKVVLN